MVSAPSRRYVLIPIAAGLLGSLFLAGVYLGIVSLAETPAHALDLFWEDRFYVIPILIGFGVQAGLFARLKLGPQVHMAAAGATTAAGGGMSTAAMVACCAHHVADVLPVLGLSAAAAFLAKWKEPFLVIGLLTNLVGILIMIRALRQVRGHAASRMAAMEVSG
jgi:hypothetical protein